VCRLNRLLLLGNSVVTYQTRCPRHVRCVKSVNSCSYGGNQSLLRALVWYAQAGCIAIDPHSFVPNHPCSKFLLNATHWEPIDDSSRTENEMMLVLRIALRGRIRGPTVDRIHAIMKALSTHLSAQKNQSFWVRVFKDHSYFTQSPPSFSSVVARFDQHCPKDIMLSLSRQIPQSRRAKVLPCRWYHHPT
jgi:hypothetical protein